MGPARRRPSGLYHANPFLAIAIVIIITRQASLKLLYVQPPANMV